MGHNTSFLTRVAENVIYVLTDAQLAKLAALAVAQQEPYRLYGYKRFPLMKAFRRLVDGDLPSGATGLDLAAVKQASRELYLIDGQVSFDRALLYATVLNSLDATQTAYLAAMKGKGWSSWPDSSTAAYQAVIKAKMQSLPPGSAVLVMTYASDLFAWYAGSVEADVYFCPERQGTYFGSFYMKDAPAIGHEGYSISEELTATAGGALCDSTKGYVTADQAAMFSGLVETQRNNLYANTSRSIVQCRTDIATLMRGFLTSTTNSAAVKARVLELSGTYGELDGENNYNYATVIAKVYRSLSADQKSNMAALRASIMSGTYADGTPFDFTLCTTPYLYSDVIQDTSVLAPYIANTDYLFGVSSSTFTLTSDAGVEGGTLPIDYTADGSGASPALSWSNVPAGTTGFVMLMTTLPGDGTTKWNWVQYNLPATASGLAKNRPVGTTGMNSDTGTAVYAPPQSQGPGTKVYTFTLYALSGTPNLPSSADQVTGDVLTSAISAITLGSASLNLSYARQAPAAAFTYAQASGSRQIVFTNASGLSATSWAWEFGDGATATEQNPAHTFAADGSYTVKLTVGNSFGSAGTSQQITMGGSPGSYALTVVSGTGSGSYASGTSVSIQATPPTDGKKFVNWTATAGTLASATESKTTFTMPAAAATVTANYQDAPVVTYALTVVNGTGSGSYAAGASVPLVAGAAATGKVFDKWTATGGTLANATSASTTFTMPAANVAVIATYAALFANGPDFVITGIVLAPERPTVGGRFTAAITVKNQGNQSGRAGYLSVWLDKRAAAAIGEPADKSAAVGTLNAGHSKTVKMSLTAPEEWREFALLAFIDARGATAETDETNNQETSGYATGMPDFEILEVWLSPAVPTVGKTFTAYVTVTNSGEVVGDAGYLDLWADSSTLADLPVADSKTRGDKYKSVGTLQVGQEKTIKVTGIKAPTDNARPVLGLLLDSRAKTLETNDGNNWREFEYECQ